MYVYLNIIVHVLYIYIYNVFNLKPLNIFNFECKILKNINWFEAGSWQF